MGTRQNAMLAERLARDEDYVKWFDENNMAQVSRSKNRQQQLVEMHSTYQQLKGGKSSGGDIRETVGRAKSITDEEISRQKEVEKGNTEMQGGKKKRGGKAKSILFLDEL
jgi:hypothetical protein